MTRISETCSLFEIDAELDDLLEQIEEQVAAEGEASGELLCRFRQFCEVHGEKVDRIGRFVRMMEGLQPLTRSASVKPATTESKRRSCMTQYHSTVKARVLFPPKVGFRQVRGRLGVKLAITPY